MPEDVAAEALQPRDDLLLEHEVAPGVFELATDEGVLQGPMTRYRREVQVGPVVGDRVRVRQSVDFVLAIPWFGFLFVPAFRAWLRRIGSPGEKRPWYLAPVRLDQRASSTLTALCLLDLVNGYVTGILSQTITFAAHQYHASAGAQGVALGVVRADAVIMVVLMALADRQGRRKVLLVSSALGCVATAAGALAPSIAWLAASQVVSRGFAQTSVFLAIVVAAEEVPPEARAFAVSILTATIALGTGVCTLLLGVAGAGAGGWRYLYLLSIAGLVLLVPVSRNLSESRRFAAPHTEATMEGHGGRLWLLAIAAFGLQVFVGPTGQFRNSFLRQNRGFSAERISLFTIATGIPGGIGLVAGGRLADLWGRRKVGAFALVVSAGSAVGTFLSSGWPMWVWATVSLAVGAAAVPTLGVYGPELFPTSLRGRANGILSVAGRLGTVLGVVGVGFLAERMGGFGGPLALSAVAPLAVAVLVVWKFPETAHQSLEALNPEDRPEQTSG
ncbi:MAG: MFS transporter [Acidimicrobiales bacterium]|nr:MFS transporter [Actinomycetota bacterium]